MKILIIITLFLSTGLLEGQPLSYNPGVHVIDNKDVKNTKLFYYKVRNWRLNIERQVTAIDPGKISTHPLGDEVARRMYLFENTYTYLSKAAPGAFAGNLVVKKPVIYKSVRKIEKYITRESKKGKISRLQGAEELCRILDFAIVLLHEDTTDFERSLRKASGMNDLITLFDQIRIQS
ncbi:MAG TPA: hypothetical protein VE912_09320 [Bacteroidales bacterium]|nr:hypothetical protein [Bacteroidales bacterium]